MNGNEMGKYYGLGRKIERYMDGKRRENFLFWIVCAEKSKTIATISLGEYISYKRKQIEQKWGRNVSINRNTNRARKWNTWCPNFVDISTI